MTDAATVAAAERLAAELGELVHQIEPDKSAHSGTRAALRALKLSQAHVSRMRDAGGEAKALRAVVVTKIGDLIETLKMFRTSMPAGDANQAAVDKLIEALA